jgi:hypothetical protein
MNFRNVLILLVALFAVFSACNKENVDITDTTGGNVIPKTNNVACDSFVAIILVDSSGNPLTLKTRIGGGTAPYTYVWSDGATTAQISVANNGPHTVTITDASGCKASATYKVDPCKSFYAVVSPEPSGVIVASPIGGAAPYLYSWSNGGTTPVLTGGTSGNTYTVTISSSNGCTATARYSISQPPCDSSTVVVTATANGALSASVNGGVPPYTYNWSNGATTASTLVNVPGTYRVTVTDANGCSSLGSIIYPTNTNPCSSLKVRFLQDTTGVAYIVTAKAEGGTSPYVYLWSNAQTTASIAVTFGNTYTVTVTDSKGCSISDSFKP